MIRKTLTLPISCEAAFDLFTRRVDEWWPPERRHAPSGGGTVVLDEAGLLDRDPDGREYELGRVKVWDPPERLALDFFIATGPSSRNSSPTAL